ncbi:hypothetical protein BH09BAC5_BH09BAC5_24390 [soil metagenome]
MKKFLFSLGFIFFTFSVSAQFFQGWGIMAGGTLGRQKWFTMLPDATPKHKFLLKYNAEIFGEFGSNPTFRWVSELQYNVKGSKLEINGEKFKYVNQYAAWNNYLMIRKELFAIIPYAKIGPRAEYVFSSDQSFKKFHFTGALGAGIEFVAYGPVKFITEAWWVPDLTKSYNEPDFGIKQHCWELRIGLKFAVSHGEACPKAQT